MSNSSKSDLDALRQMSDTGIDYSDIPALTDAFFERTELRIPAQQAENLVQVEPDIVAWFKAQGSQYQVLINAALREHMTMH